jgi:hypothetical protein
MRNVLKSRKEDDKLSAKTLKSKPYVYLDAIFHLIRR